MLAEACNVCGADPLAGLTVSHALSLVALKLKVPEPVLVMLNGTEFGLLPPTVALIVSVCGETDKIGGVAADEKFTGLGLAPLTVTA